MNHIAADAPPTTAPTKTKIIEDWKIITSAVACAIPVIAVFIGVLVYCCRRRKRNSRLCLAIKALILLIPRNLLMKYHGRQNEDTEGESRRRRDTVADRGKGDVRNG